MTLVVVGTYFFIDKKVSFAELNFTEYSSVLGETAGGMIPASCESSPPTNHAGDCLVGIRTGIADSLDSVTVNLTGGGTVWGTSRTISWTSSGATQCIASWASGWIPTSGSRTVSGSCTERDYSVNCTDGIFWSGIRTVTVFFDGPTCIAW